jgi:hypothetical protein
MKAIILTVEEAERLRRLIDDIDTDENNGRITREDKDWADDLLRLN